jgi:hypothetical protein
MCASCFGAVVELMKPVIIILVLIRRGRSPGWSMMCRIIIGEWSGQTKVHQWFVVGD